MTASNTSPPSRRLARSAVPTQVVVTLCWVCFSNTGTSSAYASLMAGVASTVMSAAYAGTAKAKLAISASVFMDTPPLPTV